MSKDCELCGKPLNKWPERSAPVMNGDQRRSVWITVVWCFGSLVALGLIWGSCISAHHRQVQISENEVAMKRACIERAIDPAVCMGTVQTVRCVPDLKKGPNP